MTKMTLLAGVAGALLASAAAATPLTMTYTVTDLGDKFRYDFALTLDNHDGTWAAGQEWDWVQFGDNNNAGTLDGFDPDGFGPLASDWITLDFDPVIFRIATSSGANNGPTLVLGPTNSTSLPGWKPTALGQALTWSGTSSKFIADGNLRWSVLQTGGGARTFDFELAHLIDLTVNPVPEPAMLGLFGFGIVGLGAMRRRARVRG